MEGKVKLFTLLKNVHKANYNGTYEEYQKAIYALGQWAYSLWYGDTLHIDSQYARVSVCERNKIEQEAKKK
ncbi:MAG: hypothetical protein A2Y17_12195 [Clostridiales bacterium GWF2_38_85]|nr:MAG: hypothetical protein A2Y17_12195 [Clostridiales bacterium GWF2_38_85]